MSSTAPCLPPRTVQYIAAGASEGQRNEELLAAACQCRDAGHSQAQAESLLVRRATLDGLTIGEALRTIASAYTKSPREPIPTTASGPVVRPTVTPEQRQRIEARRNEARLRAKAAASAKTILRDYECGFAHYGNRSPVPLFNADPREDWRLHLRLFKPDDVVWIGEQNHSANDGHPDRWKIECGRHFRTAAEWANETEAHWTLTCPSTFKPGSHSRCDANVIARRYLVLESDTLDKNQVCAVFKWMEQFSRLRAIVDTAGKSLHGWFEAPEPSTLAELKTILPVLGCDPALFRLSQPCRMPGANRNGRIQSLLYLDLEDLQ